MHVEARERLFPWLLSTVCNEAVSLAEPKFSVSDNLLAAGPQAGHHTRLAFLWFLEWQVISLLSYLSSPLFSIFLVVDILVGVKWYCIMVLICISLVTSDVG